MTDQLLDLYRRGIMFSLNVYKGGSVSAFIKQKHAYPHSFDSLVEAMDWLTQEAMDIRPTPLVLTDNQ